MKQEISFSKYKSRGGGYHYQQINKWNVNKFNAFVLARYMKHIDILKRYLKKAGYEKGSEIKILDVGCGDGVLLYLLSHELKQYSFKLCGADLSKEALIIARKKLPNGEFILTDVYDLKFESNLFDVIISSDVIEHVQDTDKMLKEIKRVAKTGALIVIGTPIRTTEKSWDIMHCHEFFQEEFKFLHNKYFQVLDLVESHDLFWTMLYERQTKMLWRKTLFGRMVLNLLAYLGYNMFMGGRKDIKQQFAYMYCVSKNNL